MREKFFTCITRSSRFFPGTILQIPVRIDLDSVSPFRSPGKDPVDVPVHGDLPLFFRGVNRNISNELHSAGFDGRCINVTDITGFSGDLLDPFPCLFPQGLCIVIVPEDMGNDSVACAGHSDYIFNGYRHERNSIFFYAHICVTFSEMSSLRRKKYTFFCGKIIADCRNKEK